MKKRSKPSTILVGVRVKSLEYLLLDRVRRRGESVPAFMRRAALERARRVIVQNPKERPHA